jgi:predicted ATPase
MRSVLDHSWRLLDAGEQKVLARLAVLRGGFTSVTAQAVAYATPHDLRSLVESSWLHRVQDTRYELHELVRQYAENKLLLWPNERPDACARHCAHFAGVLQRLGQDLHGDRQLLAIAELELEVGNMNAAWNWAVAQGDFACLAMMVEGACRFLDWRGHYQQGREICSQALQRLRPPAANAPAALLAELLGWQGRFSRLLGDLDDAGIAQADARHLLAGSAPALSGTRKATL